MNDNDDFCDFIPLQYAFCKTDFFDGWGDSVRGKCTIEKNREDKQKPSPPNTDNQNALHDYLAGI